MKGLRIALPVALAGLLLGGHVLAFDEMTLGYLGVPPQKEAHADETDAAGRGEAAPSAKQALATGDDKDESVAETPMEGLKRTPPPEEEEEKPSPTPVLSPPTDEGAEKVSQSPSLSPTLPKNHKHPHSRPFL